jgi:hypothetical protein
VRRVVKPYFVRRLVMQRTAFCRWRPPAARGRELTTTAKSPILRWPALQAGDDAPDVEVKRTPAQTARLLFSTLCCTMYCLGG